MTQFLLLTPLLEPNRIETGRLEPQQGFPESIVIQFEASKGKGMAFAVSDEEAMILAINLLTLLQERMGN